MGLHEIVLSHDKIGVVARATKTPQANGLFAVSCCLGLDQQQSVYNVPGTEADAMLMRFIEEAKQAIIPA